LKVVSCFSSSELTKARRSRDSAGEFTSDLELCALPHSRTYLLLPYSLT
jgi:hypothetical protein